MEAALRSKGTAGFCLGAAGIFLGIFPVFLAMALILAAAGAQGGTDSGMGAYTQVGNKNLSQNCERYRPLVEKYANLHGMEAFVNVIMAMMMQESGGNSEQYPDIMQASEYAGWPPNTITDPEVSIDYGIRAIRDAMQTAGCTNPEQKELLQLALQGYNYGSGYVSWALSNYGGYSKENAAEFSRVMADRLGWSSYGDPLYVEHVFQYLTFQPESGEFNGSFSMDGIREDAGKTLDMLQEGWPEDLDKRRAAVIAKGAGRIGKTIYDMYGEDTRSGVENPRTLDCSSFVAWSFQKAGFTDVPYTSTTGTFVSSPNFTEIARVDLRPGDIGLKNTIPAGGSNHVGIYVGQDGNGNAMWLHCSSYGVNGPRIDYYSNFQIFYRYQGFQD